MKNLEQGIYLITDGGLCNRMRAIDSAYILMKLLKKKLFVVWENNNDLGADFEDVFETIQGVKILNAIPKPIKSYNKKQKLLKRIARIFSRISPEIGNSEIKIFFKNKDNIENLKNYKYIFLQTHHCFLYPEDFSFFKPKKHIHEEIKKLSLNLNNHPIIGLHIRRTDHTLAIQNSPLDLFERAINKELSNNSSTKFFLATDDKQVKESLIRKFGETIMTNDFKLDRTNNKGIENAVIDLYMLSNTSKIYASYGSSFSETAYHIGNNELVKLKI